MILCPYCGSANVCHRRKPIPHCECENCGNRFRVEFLTSRIKREIKLEKQRAELRARARTLKPIELSNKRLLKIAESVIARFRRTEFNRQGEEPASIVADRVLDRIYGKGWGYNPKIWATMISIRDRLGHLLKKSKVVKSRFDKRWHCKVYWSAKTSGGG